METIQRVFVRFSNLAKALFGDVILVKSIFGKASKVFETPCTERYSTSSKFKGAKTVTISKNKTTNKTISKLKAKKKYYVRIRTYKKIGSTKYYSSWSKAKTVTTKQK